MANVPGWFDATAYFNNKLASLEGMGWDSLQLKAAFTNAGYNADSSESLYAHFVDYGNNEGMSPNKLFNVDQYLYNKAASFYSQAWGEGDPAVTPVMVQSMLNAMHQSGMTPWDHYQMFGAKEGVNPSAEFDTDLYIKAKVAKMNADKYSGKSDWTYQDVMDALVKDGMTPLTHYYLYGQNEKLDYTPGTVDNIPGKTTFLTEYRDTLYGTDGNDQFHGVVAGDLNDGDYIDGGLGYDTVKAVVGAKGGQAGAGENVASQPTIVNVEKVVFQAQLPTSVSGNTNKGVHIDAGKIQGKIHNNLNPEFEFMGKDQGLQYLGNDDSRANLVVENVRSYTTDMTIGWFNADPNGESSVNYEVYFDSQYLKSGSTQKSGIILIENMDVKTSTELGVHSLQSNPYQGISFDLTLGNGTVQRASLVAADGYRGEGATVNTMFEALKKALEASEWKDYLQISLQEETYKGVAGSADDFWQYLNGHRIVIETKEGVSGTLDPSTATWVLATGENPGGSGMSSEIRGSQTESCPLIVTSVELDNVGHVQWNDAYENCLPDEAIFGSESGTLLIGAHDNRSGIERFDVVVDRGSWISELKSTNNTLRAVTVTKGDVNGDGKIGNLEWQTNKSDDTMVGELFIGASQEKDWYGMSSWTVKPALLNTSGLQDVKYFDASGYEGHINLGAKLTEASYAKYMADVDGLNTVHQGFAPNGNFTYNLGAKADILNMEVNLGLAADVEFGLDINAGNGDDLINFAFSKVVGNIELALPHSYASVTDRNYIQDSAKLRNVTIDGGEGKDTIWSWGHGAVTVKGGAGRDRIYVGQDNNAEVAAGNDPMKYDDTNAIWVFNTDPAHKWVKVGANGAQADNNNFLATDDWASFANAGATNSGAAVYVQVNFKGFTHFVQIEGATVGADGTITYTSTAGISTKAINNAIMKTINNEADSSRPDAFALNSTLVAKEGSGYGLIIESKIDGKMTVNDLDISFFVSKDNGTTKGYVDNITDEYMTQFGTSTVTNQPGDHSGFADVDYLVGKAEVFESFKLDLSSVLSKLSVGETLMLKLGSKGYNSDVITKAMVDAGPKAILETLKFGSSYLFSSADHENGVFSLEGINSGVVSMKANKASDTQEFNPAIHDVKYYYTGDSFGDGATAAGSPISKSALTLTFDEQIKNIAVGDTINIDVNGTRYFATATAAMIAGNAAGNEALVKALTAANGTKLVGTAEAQGVFTYTSSTATTAVLTHNINGNYSFTTNTNYRSDYDYLNSETLDTEIKNAVKDHVDGQVKQHETFKFEFEIDKMKIGNIFTFDFKGKTYTTVITKDMIAHTAEAAKLIVTSLTAKDGSGLPINSTDYDTTSNYYNINGKGVVEVKAKDAVTTLQDFSIEMKDGSFVRGYEATVEKATVNFGTTLLNLSEGETYTLAFTDKDGTVTKYSVAVVKDMLDSAGNVKVKEVLLGLKDGSGKALFGDDGLYNIKGVSVGNVEVEGKSPSTSLFNDQIESAGYKGALNVSTTGFRAAGNAGDNIAEQVTLTFNTTDLAKMVAGDTVSVTLGGVTYQAKLTTALNDDALLKGFIDSLLAPLTGTFSTVADAATGTVTLTHLTVDTAKFTNLAGAASSSAGYVSGGFAHDGQPNTTTGSITANVGEQAHEAVQHEFTIAFTNLDKMSVGDTVGITIGGFSTSTKLTQEMLAGTPEALTTLVKALSNALNNAGFGEYSITVDKANPYEAVIKAPKAENSSSNPVISGSGSYLVNDEKDVEENHDWQGSDNGTYSINRVDAGAGDDVIVLNAGSHIDETLSTVKDYLVNDTLVISGEFGNDDVFNFNTGIDKVEFKVGTTKFINSGNGASANAATQQAIFNAGVTAVANAKSVGYMQIGGSNEYVFFTVENDATEAVTVGEIKVLGTMDLADGTFINTGDVYAV